MEANGGRKTCVCQDRHLKVYVVNYDPTYKERTNFRSAVSRDPHIMLA